MILALSNRSRNDTSRILLWKNTHTCSLRRTRPILTTTNGHLGNHRLVEERLQHLELCGRCGDDFILRTARTIETVLLLDPVWGPYSYAAHNQLSPARQRTFQRVNSWCGEDLARIGQYQSLTELRLIWSPIIVDDTPFMIGANPVHETLRPPSLCHYTLYQRSCSLLHP